MTTYLDDSDAPDFPEAFYLLKKLEQLGCLYRAGGYEDQYHYMMREFDAVIQGENDYNSMKARNAARQAEWEARKLQNEAM
ncbi:MAG: hypothetical protein HC892_00235 [Saprospiraceae bacterium]|nr:hypothetical protein [Saprospiraceae bacterium]